MNLVYNAGPISDASGAQCARNLEAGRMWGARLLDAGFAVYCPHCDTPIVGRSKLTLGEVYACSIELLRRCDAMFVIPNWRHSIGTHKEIEFCSEHNIPVFYTFQNLLAWGDKCTNGHS